MLGVLGVRLCVCMCVRVGGGSSADVLKVERTPGLLTAALMAFEFGGTVRQQSSRIWWSVFFTPERV